MPTTRRLGGDKLARYLTPADPARAGRQKGCPLPSPPGRVYAHARVFTVAQAGEGESLDVQQRTIAGYAQMHGLEVAQRS